MTKPWDLVQANLAVVKSIVSAKIRRFPGLVGQRDDLYQEGLLGLHYAATRFDETKGFHFNTYGAPWVLFYVGRLARSLGSPVTVSARVKGLRPPAALDEWERTAEATTPRQDDLAELGLGARNALAAIEAKEGAAVKDTFVYVRVNDGSLAELTRLRGTSINTSGRRLKRADRALAEWRAGVEREVAA